MQLVSTTAPGDAVPVRVRRNGRELTVTVRIERLGTPEVNSVPPAGDPLAGFGVSLAPVPD